MTHDSIETKFWYHGEYEDLNPLELDEKLEAHAKHCPFGVVFSAASFPPNGYVFRATTEDFK